MRYELICAHPQRADRCGVEIVPGYASEFQADDDEVARQHVLRHILNNVIRVGRKRHVCRPRLLNRIDGKTVTRVKL